MNFWFFTMAVAELLPAFILELACHTADPAAAAGPDDTDGGGR